MAEVPPVPFIEHLGMRKLEARDGVASFQFIARPEHLNLSGAVHGGACMTLLDISMAYAALSLCDVPQFVVTIELKSSFLRPAVGTLIGHGRVIHRTKRLAFLEGRLEDATGAICTTATGTFRYVRASPTP